MIPTDRNSLSKDRPQIQIISTASKFSFLKTQNVHSQPERHLLSLSRFLFLSPWMLQATSLQTKIIFTKAKQPMEKQSSSQLAFQKTETALLSIVKFMLTMVLPAIWERMIPLLMTTTREIK